MEDSGLSHQLRTAVGWRAPRRDWRAGKAGGSFPMSLAWGSKFLLWSLLNFLSQLEKVGLWFLKTLLALGESIKSADKNLGQQMCYWRAIIKVRTGARRSLYYRGLLGGNWPLHPTESNSLGNVFKMKRLWIYKIKRMKATMGIGSRFPFNSQQPINSLRAMTMPWVVAYDKAAGQKYISSWPFFWSHG